MIKTETLDKHLTAFDPIVGDKSRILVLGSMPGVASLEAFEYYAHPRNAFWPIICAVFNTRAESYTEKTVLLHTHSIALWDVLKECQRPGSLDANIRTDSMVCNNFIDFLNQHTAIERIVFNGKTAEKMFNKTVKPALDTRSDNLDYRVMPSTSPAMASLNLGEKIATWKPALL